MGEYKFVSLNVRKLNLDNLLGLTTETVDVSIPVIPEVQQPLLSARFTTLQTDVETLGGLMNRPRGSVLTPVLQEMDERIGTLYASIKRIVKTYEKDVDQGRAAAAKVLYNVLKPYWEVTKKRMASQMAEMTELFARVNGNQELMGALDMLGIGGTWEELTIKAMEFHSLYEERMAEEAASAAPSPSSMKGVVVTDYENFCIVMEQMLAVEPAPQLALLFNEMNMLRRKYATGHGILLDPALTTVEPFPVEPFTGKPVTPLPRVFFKAAASTVELQFAKDYTVTYRNNINVGEATLIIHGKGAYTGQYITTFHIAR
jgi:hypothetical protein